MALIARTIAEELAGGTSPGAIAVVGTNRIVARQPAPGPRLAWTFRQHRLRHPAFKAPKGDLAPASDNEREHVLRQLRDSITRPDRLRSGSRACTRAGINDALQLGTNPPASPCAGDSIAWRQWLSFDDALGRSAAVSELRRVAQPQGLNLAEALAVLDADALPGLPADKPLCPKPARPLPRGATTACKAQRERPADQSVTSPAAAANLST